MSYYLKAYLKLIGALVFGAALFAALALLAGCASSLPTVPVTPMGQLQQTQQTLQADLSRLNILGFVLIATAIGLGAYGLLTVNSLLEHLAVIVGAVSAGLILSTYIGLVSLPFAPYIIGTLAIIALGVGGYFLYRRLHSVKPVVK